MSHGVHISYSESYQNRNQKGLNPGVRIEYLPAQRLSLWLLSRDFWGQALSLFDGFDAMRRLGTQESKGLEWRLSTPKRNLIQKSFSLRRNSIKKKMLSKDLEVRRRLMKTPSS